MGEVIVCAYCEQEVNEKSEGVLTHGKDGEEYIFCSKAHAIAYWEKENEQ